MERIDYNQRKCITVFRHKPYDAINNFLNKNEYLKIWDGSVDAGSSDSIYVSLCWLKANGKIFMTPNLKYYHHIHEDKNNHYSQNAHKYVEFHEQVMNEIKQLKNGSMDVKMAAEIRNLLNTVIDTSEVQVEYIKSLPNSVKEQMTVTEVKAIAGTLVDRDSELDLSLAEIEESKKQPYVSGK